jgi:hypothetical protein
MGCVLIVDDSHDELDEGLLGDAGLRARLALFVSDLFQPLDILVLKSLLKSQCASSVPML